MDIEKLIEKIIPPNDRDHREGFSNKSIVSSLNDAQKSEVEDRLISMLTKDNCDGLVIDTLVYMKSYKSVPRLRECLEWVKSSKFLPIIVASSIYKLTDDDKMVDIMLDCLRSSNDTYILIAIFMSLNGINNNRIKEAIKEYINHKEFLVSYNAKVVLGIIPPPY